MIVTVGNTKGGVGKTTLALNFAIARAIAGRDVWLIDGDRQGTAQTAITIRSEAGRQPSIACAQYADGSTLHAQVQQVGPKFEDIVIDAGGRDSTALRAALVLSDVLVVPFAPRSLDVWALADICSLIDEARSVRDGLRAVAVLNNADAAGQDNEEAVEALADFPQLQYLAAPIRRRKAMANAAGQGMSVLEFSPKDSKAVEEITALVNAVFISN
jgi:chromosome partitioning protein